MRKQDVKQKRGVELPYLRGWRMYKLMSTRALSAESTVSGNTINALENQNGRALFGTVGKLAKALGITSEQLVYQQPPAIPGQRAPAADEQEGRAVA